jgi:bacteriocin-like protein
MEQILCELTETELASVAGGQTFNFQLNNQDSNQGVQLQIANNNIDSNQGNQGLLIGAFAFRPFSA